LGLNYNSRTMCGVVLAPLSDLCNEFEDDVHLICGAEAKNQLGGLQQALSWIPTRNDTAATHRC
jgi:hypothetical protein